jgi:UDP-N-acetylglucosamine 2-epimerase (non-hydrolysing)
MKICLCVGTRPNFIKAAPLIRAFKKHNIDFRLVHTGQHYNQSMSDAFFKGLNLPKPDIILGFLKDVSTEEQIRHTIESICSYFRTNTFDIVMVLGDVNSTLSCALAAKSMDIRLAHIEAGERCGDDNMVEERNRKMVDKISDYLFCASEDSLDNLIDEKASGKSSLVGNTMIDQLKYMQPIIQKIGMQEEEPYTVLTLHRAENVDSLEKLRKIWDIILKVAKKIKVVFPCHPRTVKYIHRLNWPEYSNIELKPPLPYLHFMTLVNNAKFVMTDSGGLQMETSYLNVPCITLRDSTEWLETVSHGTNAVTGLDECNIMSNINSILNSGWGQSIIKLNQLHDGNAAERIVEVLIK